MTDLIFQHCVSVAQLTIAGVLPLMLVAVLVTRTGDFDVQTRVFHPIVQTTGINIASAQVGIAPVSEGPSRPEAGMRYDEVRERQGKTMTARMILTLGAVAAFLGVALGAFGAHALRARLTEQLLSTWETAVQYHLVHALGLLVVGLTLLYSGSAPLLRWSAWFMLAGMVLFSGSLYLLCLSGVRWLGAITPLGGTALLIAWVLFVVAVWRMN